MPLNVSNVNIPLRLPLEGLNTEATIFNVPPNQTQFMYNWEFCNLGLKLRKAFIIDSGVPRSHSIDMHWLQIYKDVTYACVVDPTTLFIRYVEVTGSWPTVYAPGIAATSSSTPSLYIEFNKRLISIARPFTASAIFDGSTWSSLGYTFSTITDPYIPGVYRGRMYIAEYNGLRFEYFPVGAISGASSGLFNLNGVFNKGSIAAITNVSISDSAATDDYICFISTKGEIAYYGGDNPGASNWRLIANLDLNTEFSSIPGYATYNNFFPVGSDKYLCTKNGVFSLKQLFLNSEIIKLSSNVNTLWTELANINGVVGTYDNVSQNFYYLFSKRAIKNYSFNLLLTNYKIFDGISVLVFNRITNGWYYWAYGNETTEDDYPRGRICPFVIGTSNWGLSAGNFDRNCYFKFDNSSSDEKSIDIFFKGNYNFRGRIYFNPNSITSDLSNNRILGLKAEILADAITDDNNIEVSAGIEILDYAGNNINNPLNLNLKAIAKIRRGFQFVNFNVGTVSKTSIPWFQSGSSVSANAIYLAILSASAEIQKGSSLG